MDLSTRTSLTLLTGAVLLAVTLAGTSWRIGAVAIGTILLGTHFVVTGLAKLRTEHPLS